MNLSVRFLLSISPLLLGYFLNMVLSGDAQLKIFNQVNIVKSRYLPANESAQKAINHLDIVFDKLDAAAFFAQVSARKRIMSAKVSLDSALKIYRSLSEMTPTDLLDEAKSLEKAIDTKLKPIVDRYQNELNGTTPLFDELQWKLFQVFPPIRDQAQILRAKLIEKTNTALDRTTILSQSLFERGLIIFFIVLVISSILVLLALRRSIVTPLIETIYFLEQMSLGKLKLRLEKTGQDEIGRMRAALNRFTEQLETKIQHLAKISDGDLDVTIELASIEDQLGVAIDGMRESLKYSRSLLIEEIDDHKSSKRALQEAQSQLIQSEKMSSLGQLVAGIAHEINNPVNFLQSNFFAIQQSITAVKCLLWDLLPENEEVEEIRQVFRLEFDKIERFRENHEVGTHRLAEIVSSLKSFTRHDQAEVQLLKIDEVVNDTLVILHNRLKMIDFEVDNQSRQKLFCHASQLGQVLLNLINNAVYASEMNDKSHPKVKLSIWDEQEQLIISVEDNGPGVAKEVEDKIFDPFFTTKPIGVGTGMGLAICYQIIETHKGTFTLNSTEYGATFRVCIPFEGLKDQF